MKITPLRLAAVGILAAAMTFVGSNKASAIDVNFSVGSPPPPPPARVDAAWGRPYRGAVWIEPHYEWIGGRWAWVRGYYTYPPHPGGRWITPHYWHGRYWPGRWQY